MTSPFTAVTDKADTGDRIYLPVARCKGKLLIVRPLKYQDKDFVTTHAPEGTDAVFVDVALLDPIRAMMDEDDNELPGFEAGTQFRDQVILQGYLKGTFKRYLGKTLIGTIYKGVPTKGKPPLMWQDLSGDADCAQRGQQFLIDHPEFLVPVAGQFVEAVPEVMPGPPGYTPPPRPKADSVYTQHEPGRGPAQNTLDQMRAMAQANGGFDQEPPF
jgi:hypothetical protein